MSKHHSSVCYVEPNLISPKMEKGVGALNIEPWAVSDGYERVPRLEDYSIYFNLEVEVCGRENISSNKTITSDVLVMSYRTTQGSTASTVNFMGGTKVKCYDEKNSSAQYLTTNYADMYVGDLIDYGTTEAIGIKSVDIEYQGSCVPIVTVKFVDVRGLSLFQPTELGRTNSYQGIGGINSDNVAQTFFTCFFRLPPPKFTMTIKGFYGRPVTYECLCDKNIIDFDSQNGNFEMTARFIGYSYSFLTDVSIDALFAAPYSDYGGTSGNYNKYWAEEKDKGRFTVWNREHTAQLPMPTLYEIWEEMKSVLVAPYAEVTALNEEDNHHAEEIQELQDIKSMFDRWYTMLFNICVERFGEDFVFLFKDEKDGTPYRLLILARKSERRPLNELYAQFPKEFKQLNKDLNSMIYKYSAKKGNLNLYRLTDEDFGGFILQDLFNNMYIGTSNQVVFNGFSKTNMIDETSVIKNVFYGVNYYDEKSTQAEITEKENKHKKYLLEKFYDDGVDQYTRCYNIDVDYSCVLKRIDALVAASNNYNRSDKEKKIKALNREIFNRMSWYPTVENFTRIMMAHFETLISMMYNVASKCEGRKASELGISVGPNGNAADVNSKKDTVPPFPRVTRNILGDDNITKTEDTWVGEFNVGEKPFEEVDFIDGLFNAIDKIQSLRKAADKRGDELTRETTPIGETYGSVIKHPLSSFDFYITKNPYGTSNGTMDLSTRELDFFGRIAIRMFDIMCISNFMGEYGPSYIRQQARNIGVMEAVNFYENNTITDLDLLNKLNSGGISGDTIISSVTTAHDGGCPWGNKELFSLDNGNMWLDRYKIELKGLPPNYLYPIQDISFGDMETTYRAYNQGNEPTARGNISVYTLKPILRKFTDNSADDSGWGNVLIVNDVNLPSSIMSNANSDGNKEYADMYNKITASATFDGALYDSFFKVEGAPSFATAIEGFNPKLSTIFEIGDGGFAKVINGENTSNEIEDTYDAEGIDGIGTNTMNGNYDAYTLTEIFGVVKNENGEFIHDYESSFFRSWDENFSVKKFAFNGVNLGNNGYRAAMALLSIKTDPTKLFDAFARDGRTFLYMPKLLALQIGAVCFASSSLYIMKDAGYGVGIGAIPRTMIGQTLWSWVSVLSLQAVTYFAKYFADWCKKSGKAFLDTISSAEKFGSYISPMYGKYKRMVFAQSKANVKGVTRDLIQPILLISLSVNKIRGVSKSACALSQGVAKEYLDGFITKLREVYGFTADTSSNGSQLKTTAEPRHTTTDMKIELYRYMKQLYDKWIPMSSFDDWKLESFFVNENGEEKGHKFYFIDSYYNKIGHKLLINPRNLMEKIDAILASGDVNAMMLGFMDDIYAYNRCMMKCIQNFADLTKEGSMDEMFLPMSFNAIDWSDEVNKYPSFVVVYPYEPSRHLNIDNNEYNDDSFMLNDEEETPQAIRSKTEGQYMIPAFGVSYGKQYQSYFKSVKPNMQNPVATQQAIKAKHFILRQSADVKQKGVAAQDLYDIYSKQSYLCDVEMMGCAWVQPMMYFVLLNVPMFRGSYLVMKVKHMIRPGDMTTTFTGCRMSNVSNRLIEDIFTDEDILDNNMYYENMAEARALKADIDNDCPYKIYPLYSDNGVGANFSEELDRYVQESDCSSSLYSKLRGYKILDILAKIVTVEGGANGNELHNMLIATTLYNRRCAYGGYKKAILTQDQYNVEGALQKNAPSQITDIVRNIFTNSPSVILSKYNRTTVTNNDLLVNIGSSNYMSGAQVKGKTFTLDDLQKIGYTLSYDENKSKSNSFVYNLPVIMAQDSMGSSYGTLFMSEKDQRKYWESQPTSETKTNEKEDINIALFNAVNNSAQATPSIAVGLKLSKVKGFYVITQADGKTDKLGKVFDMMLNSEYFDKVKTLYWVYGTNKISSNPLHIDYKAEESPKPNEKTVRVAESGNIENTNTNEIPQDASEMLLRALAKRKKSLGKYFQSEAPQAENLTVLDEYMPSSCDSLFLGNAVGLQDIQIENVPPNIANGRIGDWNVNDSVQWLKSASASESQSRCWHYVKAALIKDGFTNDGSIPAYQAKGFLAKRGFKCIHKGRVKGHVGAEYSGKQNGDITVFEACYGHSYGHVDMWCDSQWISDFKQNGNWINGSAETDFSVWRYSGKGKR